jgi:hypothetical protein
MLEQQVAARELQSQEYGSNKTDKWVANGAGKRAPAPTSIYVARIYLNSAAEPLSSPRRLVDPQHGRKCCKAEGQLVSDIIKRQKR